MLENDGFSHLKWQNYDSHLKMRKKKRQTRADASQDMFFRDRLLLGIWAMMPGEDGKTWKHTFEGEKTFCLKKYQKRIQT